MFTNHRWERAKARHTAPKEQQGQEARILGKTRRGGLQGEQKAFSETTPNLSLHSFHSLDNGTGQRTQVVFGCLRLICSSAQAVFSRGDVCTHTLYNEVWAGSLDLSVTELPEAMKRKQHKDSKPREHKKNFGTDISQRSEIAALRIEEGHWESDTVVGKRAGKEAVVLSLLEKKTENYIAIWIPGKDADSVLNAMQSLREEFGDKFSQVFKTITVDNGSEFSAFSQVENWGCAVYFAHPYTSWKRPQNERHNGLFRTFVPKGVSIKAFSAEYILAAADELNGRPRKKLGYRTPEELFDEFLDSVYAAEGCGSIAQDGSQRLPS